MLNPPLTLEGINNDLAKAFGAPATMAKATTAETTGDFGTPMTDDEAPGEITGKAFMAKAMKAHKAGHVTGEHIATAELSINAGKRPPAKIVRAVMNDEPYSDFD